MTHTIVITMAGRGARFRDADYKVPKYEIVVHNRTLFEWSMHSLRHFLSAPSKIVFVCWAENHSRDFVLNQSRALGLHQVDVFEIDQMTDGQATSAYVSRALWLTDSPLLIYNIDTYVNPKCLRPELIRAGSDGWIPCFRAQGSHWSFVQVDSTQWAERVTEKEPVSDWASIGLYWFARAQDYVSAYEDYYAQGQHRVNGERYIAPMYNQLIQEGRRVSISELPADAIHALGTPRELHDFEQRGPRTL